MQYYDSKGRPVQLGEELGRGGEGVVYALAGNRAQAAKIYHPGRQDIVQREKVLAMTIQQSPDLLKVTAWPQTPLFDQAGRSLAGFIMPRIDGYKPIHLLTGPRSRQREFAEVADWRFLIRAARNLARAFAVVHGAGAVLGDVNESNILVSREAVVRIIDCDSFQICNEGRVFNCVVGVPHYQPPEVLSLPSYRELVRTCNHDNFGLGVLIFQLLFMGRHPFAGRFLLPGEMPIEKAIKEYRFAYSSHAARYQVAQPPGTIGLRHIPAPIAALFEKCFSRDHSQVRPTAVEWEKALADMEQSLKACYANSSHIYASTVANCPWCEIENRFKVYYFRLMPVGNKPADFNLESIWKDICRIPAPDEAPDWAVQIRSLKTTPSPSSRARRLMRRKRIKKGAAGSINLVAAVLCVAMPLQGWVAVSVLAAAIAGGLILTRIFNGNYESELKRIRRTSENELDDLRYSWNQAAGTGEFADKKKKLELARQQYVQLPTYKDHKIRQLEGQKRAIQLRRYLYQYKVNDVQIPGIGSLRKANLASYGIITAADLETHRLARVPGFGPELAGRLMSWRSALEKGFHYNPFEPVPSFRIKRLEVEIADRRCQLEYTLANGPRELDEARRAVMGRRRQLHDEIQILVNRIDAAESDIRAVNRWL